MTTNPPLTPEQASALFKNLGKLTAAEKLEASELLDMAQGEYVCFLDDDEWISPDYIETLLRLVYFNPDVATFRSLAMLENNWALIDMSIANENEQINPDTITLRKPWHVCPVKSEIAKTIEFSELNYGEDWVWFEQVLELCNSQQHTDRIIHNYRHGKHSEADKITKHESGS